MSIKQKLDNLFQAPIRSCEALRPDGMGLKITFERAADLTGLISVFEDNYVSQALCDLVNEQTFVVLSNASIDLPQNAYASSSGRDYPSLTQDPFHYDELWDELSDFFTDLPPQCRSVGGHITILHNPDMIHRLAPTFYASASSVKTAMQQLDRSHLSSAVIDALDEQITGHYKFSFHPDSIKARETLQKQWPEFTQRVFDLIPAQEKYQKQWRQGENEMILHARPSSADTRNRLESFNILPVLTLT